MYRDAQRVHRHPLVSSDRARASPEVPTLKTSAVKVQHKKMYLFENDSYNKSLLHLLKEE